MIKGFDEAVDEVTTVCPSLLTLEADLIESIPDGIYIRKVPLADLEANTILLDPLTFEFKSQSEDPHVLE
jgi:hypothetical protein